MSTKNITVSVDAETHRKARILAAEKGTSVSALVRAYLRNLANGTVGTISTEAETANNGADRHRDRLDQIIQEIKSKHPGFRASDRMPREQLYDRVDSQS